MIPDDDKLKQQQQKQIEKKIMICWCLVGGNCHDDTLALSISIYLTRDDKFHERQKEVKGQILNLINK